MANNIRVLIQKPVDGSGSGVQSVTGVGVDNLDPQNPVITTNAGDIGLGNVDNTSDAGKPVSTATQTALNLKQDILSEGAFVDGDKTNLDNQSNTNTGDQKTVESFPTQETTAFTVADGSDRAWIDCDFAAETGVTITATSVTVIGEPVYFSLSGDGQIKLVESGVTISFNADQSLIIGSKGDKIGLLKTGASTYEII
mgnify:CR=1 FL=1|tara:strand:+ start:1372 stop:1965 length:594 start_codon:yes stop_codon:yes gene_type:complete